MRHEVRISLAVIAGLMASQIGLARAAEKRTTEEWRAVGGNGATEKAILRTAEFERSDPRLAGLMLRCHENKIEPVIIIVEPLRPQSHPKVTLRVGDKEVYLVGDATPTGKGIRLPVGVKDMTESPWSDSRELTIHIDNGTHPIEGIVSLAGLSAAIKSFGAACAQK